MKQFSTKTKGLVKLKKELLSFFSFESLLALFAASICFRELSAIFLILLSALILAKNDLNLKRIKPIVLISFALPLILHLVFSWNNNDLIMGLKQAEKYASCIIIPFWFTLRNISFNKIIFYYSVYFPVLLVVLITIFCISNAEQVDLYFKGIETWKMGYSFSNFYHTHAPALNMHISFLASVNYFYLYNPNFFKTPKWFSVCLFSISLIALFFVNTRLAITLFFAFVIIFELVYKNKSAVTKLLILIGISVVFFTAQPNGINKIINKTFNHIEYVGKLDKITKPEEKIYGSLVTRLTVWQSTIKLSKKKLFTGFGSSDSYASLFEHYKDTEQNFLYRYKYKVHNQFLDFFLKFGVIGPITFLIFVYFLIKTTFNTRLPYALYFGIMFLSVNLFDDFMIRYDGIVFSIFWGSFFHGFKINKYQKN